MKQIITLISMALLAVSASAQVKAVDLGLSVKWGDRYIGAADVQTVGDYYAFGETETKTEYTLENYLYKDADFTKCVISVLFTTPTPAVKDVATEKLGKGWRLPTEAEFNELKNCSYETVQPYAKGQPGIVKIIGKNNNSISICATGYINKSSYTSRYTRACFYLNAFNKQYTGAYSVKYASCDFSFTKCEGIDISYSQDAYDGMCILPVYDESASGISDVTVDAQAQSSVCKYVKDGKLVIEKNGKQYNVAGVQLK